MRSETIHDFVLSSQDMDFDEQRSGEIATEVATLIAAVEDFSDLMDFDCEPLQFHSYLAAARS